MAAQKNMLNAVIAKSLSQTEFFDGNILTQPVSVVLATHNRSPYSIESPLGRFNPLLISLESIVMQKGIQLVEIIVIDDFSNDFTMDVVYLISNKFSEIVKITHVRTERLRGPVYCRLIGTQMVSTEIVAYIDDDCIYPPFYLYGGITTLLNPHHRKVGAVGLPCYYRTLFPEKVLPIDNIGRLSIQDGKWKGNFDAFPEEYFEFKVNEKDFTVMNAFEVDWCLIGCAVALKKAVLDSNAFPPYTQEATWVEAFEFSISLRDNGYHTLFCPDPKLGVFHLKFGAKGRYISNISNIPEWVNNLSIDVERLIALSENDILGSGNRKSIEEFFHMEILGYFTFFLLHDYLAANKWAVKTYFEFVENSVVYHKSVISAPSNLEVRRNIWLRSIENGLEMGERYFKQSREKVIGSNLKALLTQIDDSTQVRK